MLNQFVLVALVTTKVVEVAFVNTEDEAVREAMVVVARVDVPVTESDEVAVMLPAVILPLVRDVKSAVILSRSVEVKEDAVVVASVVVPKTVKPPSDVEDVALDMKEVFSVQRLPSQ